MNDLFTIRDLAAEFGVTTRTLRFYEEKGLLKPKRENQTRHYTNADRTRLRLILRGKRLGFTLDESSNIINLYDPTSGNQSQLKKLVNKIQEKRVHLLQQQEDLNSMLNDLGEAESRCLEAINNQA